VGSILEQVIGFPVTPARWGRRVHVEAKV